jgi:hypothetical protein
MSAIRRHSPFGQARRAVIAVLTAAGACLTAPAAVACGYHNPADMALGMMNWAYPNALYVRTAVWQAEDAGILPPRARASPKAKDLFAFNRMLKHLHALGDNLNAAGLADADRASFAVVQLDSMLWTRFEGTANGYAVQTHAAGPAKGDVVVVTYGKVITALVDGALDAARAEAHGLLRYYGPEDSRAMARKALVVATGGNSGGRINVPVSRH